MTKAERDELRRAAAEAVSQPWRAHGERYIEAGDNIVVAEVLPHKPAWERAQQRYIAAACRLAPALLAALDKQEEIVKAQARWSYCVWCGTEFQAPLPAPERRAATILHATACADHPYGRMLAAETALVRVRALAERSRGCRCGCAEEIARALAGEGAPRG